VIRQTTFKTNEELIGNGADVHSITHFDVINTRIHAVINRIYMGLSVHMVWVYGLCNLHPPVYLQYIP